jgi:hypothetical protein
LETELLFSQLLLQLQEARVLSLNFIFIAFLNQVQVFYQVSLVQKLVHWPNQEGARNCHDRQKTSESFDYTNES